MLGSDLLTTPFSYYKIFVIEENFGFNKTTINTFIIDKIKYSNCYNSFLLSIKIGLKKTFHTYLKFQPK